jgi:DNA-binding PucR family transcriptional regulator
VENQLEIGPIKDDSLESLADRIREELNCPVTIEDESHNLLAYSTHDPQTDSARIATIIGRRVPDHVVQALWRDGIIPRLMESDEPVRIAPIADIGLGGRLAVSIRHQGNVLGYIWVQETGEALDDEDVHFLRQAAQVAREKLLRLKLTTRKAQQSYWELFRQLLAGQIKSDASAREKASKLGMALPDVYQISVLQFQADISEMIHQQIHYFLTSTRRVRVAFHLVDGHRLILLAAPGEQTERLHTEIYEILREPMRQRFDLWPEREGCGSPYADYSMVARSYEEALTVLRVAGKLPEAVNIVQYSDLGIYRYLPRLSEERIAHPADNANLRKLRLYDQEHGSNLLQTLETYLDCDSQPKAAAEALHVHANTLKYRLGRIEEIGSIDLGQMKQKATLFLELKLNRFGEINK